MKKVYVTPEAQKVSFQYDEVVAASGTGGCQETSTLDVVSHEECNRCTTMPSWNN